MNRKSKRPLTLAECNAKNAARDAEIETARVQFEAQQRFLAATEAAQAAKRITKAKIAEHLRFLTGTLIPDLRRSGDSLADDFALAVRITRQLQGVGRVRVSQNRIGEHVAFLAATLIPDLRDAGRDFMAEDFQLCVTIICQLQAVRS